MLRLNFYILCLRALNMRPMPPETTARARSDAALGSFTIWLIQRALSGGDDVRGLNYNFEIIIFLRGI